MEKCEYGQASGFEPCGRPAPHSLIGPKSTGWYCDEHYKEIITMYNQMVEATKNTGGVFYMQNESGGIDEYSIYGV